MSQNAVAGRCSGRRAWRCVARNAVGGSNIGVSRVRVARYTIGINESSPRARRAAMRLCGMSQRPLVQLVREVLRAHPLYSLVGEADGQLCRQEIED